MKVDVYESIRFHALRKRRRQASRSTQLALGLAALAILIASSAGVLHPGAAHVAAGTSEHYGADLRN